MVTRRDLAEAQSFERRRVVAAFVSGTPDGRDAEPPRTGRLLLGGVVLAVLVLLGSVAAGPVEELLTERGRSGAAPQQGGAKCEGAPDADVEGSCWRRIGDSNP